MRNFLKVIAFSLVTIAFFGGYSNFGIPMIEPAPPPKEEKLDLGSMTMDKFIVLGEKIFNGKGTCTLCHNALGGRAPLLDKAATVAADRIADAKYKGKATDVESYLSESMTEPSAFVAAGFGKAGTNDTESPMPNVTSGSIGLAEAEIKAVVAYLQNLSGAEVTVEIPTGAAAQAAVEDQKAAPPPAAKPIVLKTPEEILVKGACGACHKVADQVGAVGPNLSTIGALRDKEHLRRSILDPNAEVTEGFPPGLMPPDYGEKLYAKELEILVDYLAGLK